MTEPMEKTPAKVLNLLVSKLLTYSYYVLQI